MRRIQGFYACPLLFFGMHAVNPGSAVSGLNILKGDRKRAF